MNVDVYELWAINEFISLPHALNELQYTDTLSYCTLIMAAFLTSVGVVHVIYVLCPESGIM